MNTEDERNELMARRFKEFLEKKEKDQYNHPLANAVHDSQQAFGLNKYGITLDQVPDDKYDWQLMALEESVDMNQYLVREMRILKELYSILFNTHEETFQELTQLQKENLHLNQRLEHLKGHMQGKDKLLDSVTQQNEELKERIEQMQNYYNPLDPRGPIGPNGMDYFTKKQVKELTAHGYNFDSKI